jgi:ketosteroid isomerase-like protein
MISDSELDGCFDTEDFAQNAVFTVSGSPVTVAGYFTAGSDAAEQYGILVEAVDPTFTCRTTAITGVTRGTAVTVNSASYTVQRVQKIGTGVSVCYLK